MKPYFLICLSLLVAAVAIPASSQELRSVRQSDNSILIVFVHGVRDDGEETWTNRRTGASWPDLLISDPVFDSADIATYHYPSNVWERGGLSISQVADDLRLRLESSKFDQYDQVVFVSHSMGGLVTRNFLLKNREYAAQVPLMFFLATPSGGSNLADIASYITGNNDQIRGLQELENNNFLQDQTSSWQSWAGRTNIKTLCAYETVPTKRFYVVEQVSAQLLCTEKPVPVAENHSNIVKPNGPDATVYIAFKTAFQQTFDQPLFEPDLTNTILVDENWKQPERTILADELVIASDIELLPGTTIFANQVTLRGHTLFASDLVVVAAAVSEGIIDGSGSTFGESGSEIVVAAAQLSGVRIKSRGANGKDGEDGQNGAAGASGQAGTDGRCDGFGNFRSPRPGTNGANGQDGTDGQGGAPGGNGGQIYVLSLTPINSLLAETEGGRGGFGGQAGQGGQGGQGGPGGQGCFGLGGSKPNAANGRNGADGRNGVDGREGAKGQDGELWFKQLESLQDISALLPISDELIDYRDRIREDIKILALR
ncbi:esterase/lipase family protein [Thalassococcus sp. BH17M4-6]|uniref:esterase/lipase family protein n=1 Tax=Thalassococcus sp. BH17M4-6 TaxID=3413148 RepID=UPI003BD31C61